MAQIRGSQISGSVASASYALTASYLDNYIPPFPYTGSALITGSLGVTGSLSVFTLGATALSTFTILNTATTTLFDSTIGKASIGWGKRNLFDAGGSLSADWTLRILYDSQATPISSVNWKARLLTDASATTSIDWGSRILSDTSQISSVNWKARLLTDTSATTSIDWANRRLLDKNQNLSVLWDYRVAYDSHASQSIHWNNRALTNTIGTSVVDWENLVLTDPNAITSVDWNSRYLYDSEGNTVVDWESKALNDSNGTNTIYWDAYNNNYKITQYGYAEVFVEDTHQEDFSSVAAAGMLNAAGEQLYVTTNIDPAVAIGDLVSLGEDGIWYQTDQASISGSCMLAICLNGYNKGIVFTEGTITATTDSGITDIPFVEGTSFYGKPVYMRPGVLGGLTTTTPASGYVRVVGHMYYNNQTDANYWLMKFRPSNDWYEI